MSNAVQSHTGQVSEDGHWIWNGTEWVANAPVPTPHTNKKSGTGKKVLVGGGIALALLIGMGMVAGSGEDTAGIGDASVSQELADAEADDAAGQGTTADEATEAEPEEVSLTVSQENALGSAEDYLSYSAFSRSGLIEQLEFEGYSTKDATFAVDAVGADWKEQAAKSAEEYLDFSNFSRSGLIEQLEFEGFKSGQAAHGADSVGL